MPIRAEIINKYRIRIVQGSRTKLRKAELETLIDTFIDALATVNTPDC